MSGEERWVEKTLAGMSLERKIAQIVVVGIEGGYRPDGDPRVIEWERLARDLGVGGFVVYGGTPRDVAGLVNRLQGASRVPLLFSSDFEGGPGQQVAGASEFPGDMALSAVGSEELAYRVGAVGGEEGRAMGINLTYSPVADVSVDPRNPAESVRTFGGDLDLLARMLGAYVRGYHEQGMLVTAKHFPGRGDVRRMPAWPGFACIDKPAAQVEAQEFRAFASAIAAGVDVVMTEHIAVPSVTGGSELPASVEPALTTGWLREKLGFRGLVSSDDLWYDAVVERFGAEEVAVKALLAGHDALLKPRDPAAAIRAVAEAVRAGRVPQERVDAAARRLLTLKARVGLHRGRLVDEARVGSSVGTPAHLAVVQEVADRSLTLLRNDGVLPCAAGALARVVNLSIQKAEADPSPAILAARLAAALPGSTSLCIRPEMEPQAYERAFAAAADASLVVVSLFVPRDRMGDPAPLRPADRALIQRLAAAHPRALIIMSYGNPYLVEALPEAPAFAVGWGEKGWFGNQAVYFDSFIKLVTGALKPEGRLPVLVSGAYPIGAGLRLQ
jgi:beta-N-acetylhexosaminidase